MAETTRPRKPRTFDGNGYVRVYMPDHPLAYPGGYVAEHRRIAYDAGLLTDASCHVHHINGDKQDNRLENLEVLTAREHVLRHMRERGVVNGHGVFPLGSGRKIVSHVE